MSLRDFSETNVDRFADFYFRSALGEFAWRNQSKSTAKQVDKFFRLLAKFRRQLLPSPAVLASKGTDSGSRGIVDN